VTGPLVVQRVGVVVAMPSEMAPVRRLADLRADGETGRRCTGQVGDVDVVAVTSGIGTERAAAATERLLDDGAFDRVVMIGICGGVGLPVGTVVVPEIVVDGASGAELRPSPIATRSAAGMLWTADEMTGTDDLGWLRARGIVAVDMETSAVGAVCAARGVPWSAIRAVSDPVGPPGADEEILGLTRADGTPNLGAVARYLVPRVWRLGRLLRLARGARTAATAAARALCDELVAHGA
jgi:adenosylhomocysteine nucleosidase